jgi:hypothetical protein
MLRGVSLATKRETLGRVLLKSGLRSDARGFAGRLRAAIWARDQLRRP